MVMGRRVRPILYLLIILSIVNHVIGWSLWPFNRRKRHMFHFAPDTPDGVIHQTFMNLALQEARKAGRRSEVPIGALVVKNHTSSHFEILGRAGNRVESWSDASAHAELIAMRRAGNTQSNWRLLNCTLYATLEPCPICLASAQAFRIARLVYGAPDHRLGAVVSHIALLETPHPYHTIDECIGGVYEETSADLVRGFFRRRRKEQRNRKKK